MPDTPNDDGKPKPAAAPEAEIDRPRLTPQGHAAGGPEDETDPNGGMKTGQPDPAEGA